ncbi:hypothetical protein CANCADRAFT_44274 [Tortispora caseinolytica NRRL Y-17796]|uniref:Kinesin motor domain-containing protein n=1 Tax=Tortispora caseinolytica NRRL Y-17796 TaxID=767744 RepID=A0A1E4TG27_9ASCO|nr:hypothetical protein CANCADRAFT_44274 [Tortispora caseinolytica NRRL Y-17796]
MVDAVFQGTDATFFAMGPTNSGKSHSLFGDSLDDGLTSLAFEQIFERIGDNSASFNDLENALATLAERNFNTLSTSSLFQCKQNKTGKAESATETAKLQDIGEHDYRYGVYLSVVQIYNNTVTDLLDQSSRTKSLQANMDGTMNVAGVNKIHVANLSEANQILAKALKKRSVHSTALNSGSSRSHALCSIEICKLLGSNNIELTKLTIADLAGSERVESAKASGSRLVESRSINSSLMHLGHCLEEIRKSTSSNSGKLRGNPPPSLRNSKLNQILLNNLYSENRQPKACLFMTADLSGDIYQLIQMFTYSLSASGTCVPLRQQSPKKLALRAGITSNASPTKTKTRDRKAEAHSDRPVCQEIDSNELEERVRQSVTLELGNTMKAGIDKYYYEFAEARQREQKIMDRRLDLISKQITNEQALRQEAERKLADALSTIALLRAENERLTAQLNSQTVQTHTEEYNKENSPAKATKFGRLEISPSKRTVRRLLQESTYDILGERLN